MLHSHPAGPEVPWPMRHGKGVNINQQMESMQISIPGDRFLPAVHPVQQKFR